LTAPAAASRGPKRHDRATDEARLRRYGADHTPEDREWLVVRYLPLARHVAARYRGGSEPIEDLEQVASLALVKAIDRFDASRGTSFAGRSPSRRRSTNRTRPSSSGSTTASSTPPRTASIAT